MQKTIYIYYVIAGLLLAEGGTAWAELRDLSPSSISSALLLMTTTRCPALFQSFLFDLFSARRRVSISSQIPSGGMNPEANSDISQ